LPLPAARNASDLVHASKVARFCHTVLRRIERVILCFRTPEKAKLDEARHLFELAIARQPDLPEGGFAALGNLEAADQLSSSIDSPQDLRNSQVPS
jgi:hypothetical protein